MSLTHTCYVDFIHLIESKYHYLITSYVIYINNQHVISDYTYIIVTMLYQNQLFISEYAGG